MKSRKNNYLNIQHKTTLYDMIKDSILSMLQIERTTLFLKGRDDLRDTFEKSYQFI